VTDDAPPRIGLAISAILLLTGSLVALWCLQRWYLVAYAGVFLAMIAVYTFAAWRLLRRVPLLPTVRSRVVPAAPRTRGGRTLLAILAVAALMRVIALFAPEALSTDAFRYVWDGRVAAAGINPYRYIPADPHLAPLRDAAIYPNINRANYAHTIYPPTAQLAFLGIERLSDSILGLKLGMLAFDGVSIACLIALLQERGLPATRVLLYAWHPLPIWEFAGTGHVDAIAIALVLLTFLCAARRAPVLTGIALAAAALVKYYPLIAAPAVYRRWDWKLPLAFVLTAALLYLPYLGAGTGVFGFLPGYANEEGLHSGSGLFLWALLQTRFSLPADGLRYYLPFAALVLAALSVWVLWRRRDAADRSGLPATFLLASAFTLLVSPHDPWYFAWLVPFLCFEFSLAHVWLTAACVLLYVAPYPLGVGPQALIYVPFVLLLVLQTWASRQLKKMEGIDANRARTLQ
jgi:hypothetical protein